MEAVRKAEKPHIMSGTRAQVLEPPGILEGGASYCLEFVGRNQQAGRSRPETYSGTFVVFFAHKRRKRT